MKKYISTICRVALGLVFAYAGASKLLDPRAFSASIDHYHLLPYPLVVIAAVYLPWLEIICGTAVLIHWRYRGALFLIVGLCTLFSAALASAWLRGLNVECGCFGQALTSSLPMALLRSLSLGAIGLFLLLAGSQGTDRTRLSLPNK